MCDVGKRTAVNERRLAFACLHEIGFDCVFEQNGHRSDDTELMGVYRFLIVCIANKHSTEPLLRSVRSFARHKMAMISEATVMSKPLSRGMPLVGPPRPTMVCRS